MSQENKDDPDNKLNLDNILYLFDSDSETENNNSISLSNKPIDHPKEVEVNNDNEDNTSIHSIHEEIFLCQFGLFLNTYFHNYLYLSKIYPDYIFQDNQSQYNINNLKICVDEYISFYISDFIESIMVMYKNKSLLKSIFLMIFEINNSQKTIFSSLKIEILKFYNEFNRNYNKNETEMVFKSLLIKLFDEEKNGKIRKNINSLLTFRFYIEISDYVIEKNYKVYSSISENISSNYIVDDIDSYNENLSVSLYIFYLIIEKQFL